MHHATPPNVRRATHWALTLGCFGLVAAGSAASAQEKTTLRKVQIVGLQRLSADQVRATSGLRVGDLIYAATLDAAADKLMRSRWFATVNYRVSTVDSDSTVTFEVAEKGPSGLHASSADVLGKVTWSGNKALTQLELANAFGLRPGDAFSSAQIDQALVALRGACGRRGFINAQIVPSSTRDATSHHVNYDFVVREGQQYLMGTLNVLGISAADAAMIKSKWTLAANTVFDAHIWIRSEQMSCDPLPSAILSAGGSLRSSK